MARDGHRPPYRPCAPLAVGLALRGEFHQLTDFGTTTVEPVVADVEEHERGLAIERGEETEAAVVVPFADLAESLHAQASVQQDQRRQAEETEEAHDVGHGGDDDGAGDGGVDVHPLEQ